MLPRFLLGVSPVYTSRPTLPKTNGGADMVYCHPLRASMRVHSPSSLPPRSLCSRFILPTCRIGSKHAPAHVHATRAGSATTPLSITRPWLAPRHVRDSFSLPPAYNPFCPLYTGPAMDTAPGGGGFIVCPHLFRVQSPNYFMAMPAKRPACCRTATSRGLTPFSISSRDCRFLTQQLRPFPRVWPLYSRFTLSDSVFAAGLVFRIISKKAHRTPRILKD
ncbi:hypothetical protein LZ30DRAFT_50234 [Colletotrichum cereale]|nr:hypothetical protein LZ30DRAFT_50234 [Colletotrichum cereale]